MEIKAIRIRDVGPIYSSRSVGRVTQQLERKQSLIARSQVARNKLKCLVSLVCVATTLIYWNFSRQALKSFQSIEVSWQGLYEYGLCLTLHWQFLIPTGSVHRRSTPRFLCGKKVLKFKRWYRNGRTQESMQFKAICVYKKLGRLGKVIRLSAWESTSCLRKQIASCVERNHGLSINLRTVFEILSEKIQVALSKVKEALIFLVIFLTLRCNLTQIFYGLRL